MWEQKKCFFVYGLGILQKRSLSNELLILKDRQFFYGNRPMNRLSDVVQAILARSEGQDPDRRVGSE